MMDWGKEKPEQRIARSIKAKYLTNSWEYWNTESDEMIRELEKKKNDNSVGLLSWIEYDHSM